MEIRVLSDLYLLNLYLNYDKGLLFVFLEKFEIL